MLPHWLVRLHAELASRDEPHATVEMTVTNSSQSIELVRSGAAELGFIETPNVPLDLGSATLLFDELVAVAAPTSMWAMRRSLLTANALGAMPLITRERGSGTRVALENALEKCGVREIAPPLLELNTTAAVRSAIASGTGPGVLSALAVKDDIALGRLTSLPVVGLDLSRPITALWRVGKNPPAGLSRDLVAVAQRQPSQ